MRAGAVGLIASQVDNAEGEGGDVGTGVDKPGGGVRDTSKKGGTRHTTLCTGVPRGANCA